MARISKAAMVVTSLCTGCLSAPVQGAVLLHGLPPIPSDPAIMALAQKAVGHACRFAPNKVGPQVADFTNVLRVGQGLEPDGFTFVRKHGPQRVAFLALDVGDRCLIVAAQPLPPAVHGDEFQECEVDNPDPMINTPISSGLGLRQGGKGLAAYLEADIKARTLTPRDPTDKRIRCAAFETGE